MDARDVDERLEDRPLVLVVGGSGLIGGFVVRALRDHYPTLATDRSPPTWFDKHEVRWHKIEITDPGSVSTGLDAIAEEHGRRLASVIQLAAFYDFTGAASPLYREVNVDGTLHLLDAVRDRFEVAQFVYASTMLVHRADCRRMITEDSPFDADWAYPESKLAAEREIDRRAGDIPVVIARIAAVYDEWCHSLPISQQILRAHRRQLEASLFPGDLDSGNSFVELTDLGDAFRRIVERRAQLGRRETFLLAEPDPPTYADLQRVIGQELRGRPLRTLRIPKFAAKWGASLKSLFDRDGEAFIKPWMIDQADDCYRIDASHAREVLGWEPKHRVLDTVPKMIAHLREDPTRWIGINEPLGAVRKPEEAAAATKGAPAKPSAPSGTLPATAANSE